MADRYQTRLQNHLLIAFLRSFEELRLEHDQALLFLSLILESIVRFCVIAGHCLHEEALPLFSESADVVIPALQIESANTAIPSRD